MSKPIEIYGHSLSQPSRTVFIFCDLSNILYQLKTIEFFVGEHLKPEFTSINPYQEIPTIVHGDFILWESAAIIKYLADIYNIDNQWYPRDPKIKAKINAYIHWHHLNVREPLVTYIRKKIIFPKFVGKPEMTESEEAITSKKAKNVFQNLAWILKDTGYIARTSHPTIADVYAYSEIASSLLLPIKLTDYPVVKAWFDNISRIPEIQKHHAENFIFVNAMNPSPKL